MTPLTEGSYFGPKHLEQTTLSHIHFIENSQGKARQGYLNVEGPRVVADVILATLAVVTQNLNHLNFPLLLWQFLYTQLPPPAPFLLTIFLIPIFYPPT